jgi:hypothetical protein
LIQRSSNNVARQPARLVGVGIELTALDERTAMQLSAPLPWSCGDGTAGDRDSRTICRQSSRFNCELGTRRDSSIEWSRGYAGTELALWDGMCIGKHSLTLSEICRNELMPLSLRWLKGGASCRVRGEALTVSKQDDYRRHAAETVDLASRASSTADKRRLLAMAEAWLDLADRAHRSMHRHASRLDEHPLLNSKLGRDQREAE